MTPEQRITELETRIRELEYGLTWFLQLHGHRLGEGCEYCDKYHALLK